MTKRERRHSCFQLNVLMVVEMAEQVNHAIGYSEGSRSMTVDAFCFEDGEEILSHGVIIAVILF